MGDRIGRIVIVLAVWMSACSTAQSAERDFIAVIWKINGEYARNNRCQAVDVKDVVVTIRREGSPVAFAEVTQPCDLGFVRVEVDLASRWIVCGQALDASGKIIAATRRLGPFSVLSVEGEDYTADVELELDFSQVLCIQDPP
jgi:hypothetical protein